MRILHHITWIGLLFAASAVAQDGGRPEDFETEADRRPSFQTGGNLLIRGATILTVTNGTLENAAILIKDGKIKAIGHNLQAPANHDK